MASIKTIGTSSKVLTARERVFNYDEDEGNTCKITYEVPESKLSSAIPSLGSTTSEMSGVVLQRVTVTSTDGGLYTVVLEYGKDDDDDDDDDDDEDVVSWSLEGSVNDVSILAHPKAENIGDDEREYLKMVMNGTRPWEEIEVLEENGEPKRDKHGNIVKAPLKKVLASELSETGKHLYKFIRNGIHSYRSPSATFRVKMKVATSAVSISGLGKIAEPENAPSVSNRNWLLVGASYSRTGSSSESTTTTSTGSTSLNVASVSKTKTWEVEYIYELSDEGGWDPDIYS